MGGFSSTPPCPRSSSPSPTLVAVGPPGVSFPRGSLATPGVLAPCGDSTPPPTPWWPPWGFLPLRRPRGPPPCPPLWGNHGPLRRPRSPCRCPALPRFCCPYFPSGVLFSLLAPASPHGGPALPPRWRPWRVLSQCRSRRPSHPPVLFLRRFLACHMATLSAVLFSPPPPPRSFRPPPSLIPPNPPRSYRSTPRSRRHSPPGRPFRGALPCLCRCLPRILGPVSRAPSLPSSSHVRSSSSSLYLPLRAAFLLLPHSSLPLRLVPPLPPSGPCGRSPCPSRPFPRPWPPISPIGMKILAIGRMGYLRAGWWRAGPRLARRTQVGPSP